MINLPELRQCLEGQFNVYLAIVDGRVGAVCSCVDDTIKGHFSWQEISKLPTTAEQAERIAIAASGLAATPAV